MLACASAVRMTFGRLYHIIRKHESEDVSHEFDIQKYQGRCPGDSVTGDFKRFGWCLNKAGVKQSYTTSSGWRSIGKYTKITNFNSLQAGDIIVVSGHVGIVAGGGTVIDASSSNGKVVHRSLSSWWRNNFICGWRIF